MRKVLIFALTIAIALGGLGFAHAAVTESQDDLLIYPIFEVGDRAPLDGMTASMVITCGEHLRWHTDYTFGGEAETRFVYDRKATPETGSYSRNLMTVWFSADFGSSTSGTFSLRARDYGAMFQAVAAATANGESKSMNLDMADYVDYYLPDFEISYEDDQRVCHMNVTVSGLVTGEAWYEEEGNYRQFMERFRFPVQDGHIFTVTVGKNEAGGINDLYLSPENGPELSFLSDVNAEGIWFVPIFRDENGTPLPYESPEGHGIYFMPWKKTGTIRYASGDKDSVLPDVDNAQRLFTLAEDLVIEHMQIDAESGEAWMLSREEGSYVLTSYDLTAGEVLARLPLLPHDPAVENENAWFERDGDHLLVTVQDHIALVDAVSRQLLLSAPDTNQRFNSLTYNPDTGTLQFDGERLILLDPAFYRDGTFWTAVFAQDELLYYGEYDCSLMRGNDDWYYNYITADQDPITLK